MKYLPLLNLYLTHTYYANGRCPDFGIEPTLHTRRLLNNYRCVLKQASNGIRILTAVTDQNTPFIPMQKGKITFAFHLHLQNPDFILFTDLTENAQATDPLYTNADMALENPVQLELVSRQTGANAVMGQPTQPVFANVEINYNNSLPAIADGPGEFQIAFKAKKARWQYYIIADSTNGTQFHIVDTGTPPLTFSPENGTDLNQHPDPTDAIAQTLADQYPTRQRLRFVSDDPIPCRQAPRKLIQLQLDGHQVAGALPNPSLRNYATMEIISNESSQKEAVLFQVFKYFAQ